MNTSACVEHLDPKAFRLPLGCKELGGTTCCSIKTERFTGAEWAKWFDKPLGKPARRISFEASCILCSRSFGEDENHFALTDRYKTEIVIFPGNFFPDGEQGILGITSSAQNMFGKDREIKPLNAVLACLTARSLSFDKVRGGMGFDEIIFVHKPFVLFPLTTNPSAQLLMLKYPPEGGIFLDVFPVDSLNNVTERTGLAFGVFSQGEPRQNS